MGGCTDTETTSITVNPGPDATITPSGPFCANTGSVTLVAATAGGTWSGPGVNATTGEFNPATAGAGVHVITYSVTVGSCTDTDTQNILVRPISDPACGGGGGICDPAYTNALVSTFTRPSCTTQDDGSLTFTVAGGLANYFVELTGDNLVQQKVGAGPDFVFNNLSPDENYQFVVTDALGRTCAITHSLNVQPNVNATASSFVDATCSGGIGKATITVTGGSSPFEYFDGVTGWIEFISGNPVDLPSNGTYNVLVRDDASDLCPASVSVTVNAATPPITFNVSAVTDVSTCGGEDGSFTVENVVGGAGTYQIRLVRETALGNEVVVDFEPLNQTNAHEYPAELAAGSYIAVIQDLNGCTVNTNPVAIDGPGSIDFSVVKLRDTECGSDNMAKNGQAGILLTTSGSYQVGVSTSQFSEPSEYANLNYAVGDPNPTIDTLSRGTFFIFIKPATGTDCPSVRSVTIEGAYALSFGLQRICNPTGPSGLNLVDVVADPAGSNLSISIYASNDLSAPIDPVLIAPHNEVIAIEHPVLAIPGDYFIEIQQTQALCAITSSRVLYTVSPAMTLVVEDIVASLPEPRSTGSFTLKTVIGGLPLNGDDGLYYEATLVDPTTNSTIEGPFNVVRNPQGNYEYKFKNMPIGTYRLDITDAYGCQASFVSIVPHNTDIIIPNIFTPNNDEVNDLFEIVNLPEGGKHKLVITNRWGKEMFTSSDYKAGTFWNAEDAPEGIYFYRLQVSGGKTYSGWVEILRGARP
jgi:gliding motility-associated-like protein